MTSFGWRAAESELGNCFLGNSKFFSKFTQKFCPPLTVDFTARVTIFVLYLANRCNVSIFSSVGTIIPPGRYIRMSEDLHLA